MLHHYREWVARENLTAKITYTRHFWHQFKEQSKASPVPITMELVEETIRKPDLIMQDPRNPEREWRIKKVAGYCFKVIVENRDENRDNEMVVITLMLDRGLRRKGLCE